ncbi:hypothetical protein GO730_37610 [Spirosoma sp. HMF3257]|uniref:hypothetical protein n=1 Tax=Spirosoma telluris TaxID=2183553 RepID=UPI0012FC42D3|nr:hypothetical protein [Spirosoma telluris]
MDLHSFFWLVVLPEHSVVGRKKGLSPLTDSFPLANASRGSSISIKCPATRSGNRYAA